MKGLYSFILVLVFCWSGDFTAAFGQVMINEISNANDTAFTDHRQETPDYIELYNAGPNTISLAGYSVTDNPEKPRKWVFPQVNINPGAFLLLLASGEDTVSSGSLHLSFKLSEKGEKILLFDPNGKMVDTFTVGVLQSNHSMGRKPDGAVGRCLFGMATPGKSNNASACYDGYEPDPVFSLKPGMYSSAQTLSLSVAPGGELRYTTDGRFPSPTDKVYAGAIRMDSSMVVSVRNYSKRNRLPGNMIKNTYMIGEKDINLPVISISMNPADLFDENTGIYVKGPNADSVRPYFGANFWQDWEKVCYLEYYDKNMVKQFDAYAGLKIHGGYSRAKPQKSFRVTFRGEYGTSKLEYPLIPEKDHVKTFNSFNLRNGGQDKIRFRDAFLQRVMKNGHVGTMAYEPAIVFLNGRYWGEYEIREKQDEKYIESNYGVPADKVDMLSHQGILKVRAGSDSAFYTMYKYIMNSNPSDAAYYSRVSQMLDVENVVDYFAAEIFYDNDDWLRASGKCNNIRLWRSQLPGGKWKYLFWDLDQTCGLYGAPAEDNSLAVALNPQSPNVHSDMLRTLCRNTTFRNYFVNRYADLMNTVFQQENLKELAYAMRDSISPSMRRHYERWGGIYDDWYKATESMLKWMGLRLPVVRQHINSQFALNGQVEITLKTSPANAGRIKINTVSPGSLPWTGVYFNGVPVTITVIANPGYTFHHWEAGSLIAGKDSSRILTINVTNDATFTAHFSGTAQEPQLAFTEINYHPDSSRNDGDWVELSNYGTFAVDLSEWTLKDRSDKNTFVIPFGTVIKPGQRLVFITDTLRFAGLRGSLQGVAGQLPFAFDNSGDKIRLFDHRQMLKVSASYSDGMFWPRGADGYGRTLELTANGADPHQPASWFDGCMGGSPLQEYTDCQEDIVFSEINYNSSPARNTEDWVELHNLTADSLDLSGWKLANVSDSGSYVFPPHTVLPANGHLVVSGKPESFAAAYPAVSNMAGSFRFSLAVDGDVVRLYDKQGTLRFSVCYTSVYPWPSEANGQGKTLELRDPAGRMNSSENWFAGCYGGSPGTSYLKCPEEEEPGSDPFRVQIWPNPARGDMNILIELEETHTRVEIYNVMGEEVGRVEQLAANSLTLSRADFPAGVYFVRIENGDLSVVKKIVFQ
jgi:hypothetical protein